MFQTSASDNGTICITGGAGYIGSATVLYMLQKGYNIVVIDNKFPESSYFAQTRKIDPRALLTHSKEIVPKTHALDAQFFEAARTGNIEAIKSLLKQGVSINTRDPEFKATVLHWVIGSQVWQMTDQKRVEMVQFLINETDIDINATNLLNSTPLLFALYNSQEAIAELLLQQPNIDIHRTNNAGETAFTYAKTDKIKSLLQERENDTVRRLPTLSFDNAEDLKDKVVFIRADFADRYVLDHIFKSCKIDAVIHFAGFLEVNKSVRDPEPFYQNNVRKTLILLSKMREYKINKFIFSSSAAIYGLPAKPNLLLEEGEKKPINPYGNTKRIIEMILEDYAKAYHLQAIALRFFNAAGALPEFDIGERHDPETHAIPLLLRAAYESRPFFIFGDDYKTKDHSCIRDYLHIYDIAEAHYLSLQHLNKGFSGYDAFNLGTGHGSSVKELITTAEKVTGIKITTHLAPRRAGDPDCLIADPAKAQSILGWEPKYSSLEHILLTAHQFHTSQRV